MDENENSTPSTAENNDNTDQPTEFTNDTDGNDAPHNYLPVDGKCDICGGEEHTLIHGFND